MNDDKIIDFIKNYIDKTSYNYAILIDGSWGSGKTYFIENKLIPSIKENQKLKVSSNKEYKEKKIIYISLYGITSRAELIKQMFIETMPFSDLLKSKKFGVVSGFSKTILAGALSYTGITLPDKTIDNSDFISLENCILIFDDLERCDMNVNEVLGYINNFVEHDGIKVIIAANEKELATPRITLNKELKYLIATNENILFPEEKNENQYDYNNLNVRNNSANPTKIDVKELDKRNNYLFGEDELYKLIKEKLIGETIFYKPELTSIIDEIVNKNITDENANEIVLDNKGFIKGKFSFYEHYNIRTLLFGIDKFESLIVKLKEDIDITNYRKVFDEIFKYFIVISIIYKSGKPLYKWEDDSEIKVIPLTDSSNMRDYIKSFKFADYFISKSIFNKEKVIEIIKKEKEILKKQTLESSDPLSELINGWHLMDDKKAGDMMKKVISTLKNYPGHYYITNYSKILYHNIFLYRIGVNKVETNHVLEIMKNNLYKFEIDSNYNLFGSQLYFDEEQDKVIYKESIEKLKEEVKKLNEQRKLSSIENILKNTDEWANKLSEYVFNNKNEILKQKAFLIKFKFDELIRLIKYSSNSQIIDFRGIINDCYDNTNNYYKEDKNIIEKITYELEIYLDEIKDEEKIRSTLLQLLIDDLKKTSEQLNQ